MWSIIKETLETLSYVGTAGGLIFAGIQLLQIKSNRRKQYEQARREKTAEMIMYYAQRVNPKTKYIEKIVSNFSEEQCQDLYDCVPFNINKETKDKLCSVCPYNEKCQSSGKEICINNKGKYVVENELLYYLRSNIISYLNTLENVLLTKDLGIVEEEIIVEQFAFLNKKCHIK